MELATIKEASSVGSATDMVKELVSDLETLNKEALEALKLAQEDEDETTVDLFIGISSSFEKHIWMYRAFLG